MANYTHRALTNWADRDHAVVPLGTQTAMLESFIAHARLVDEFLGGRPRVRSDDVHASQFVPDWQHGGFLHQRVRDLADKQLLHLTRGRIERLQWPIHAIARGMGSTMILFLGALSEGERHLLEDVENSSRELVERADGSWTREVYLGLVWEERTDNS